MVTKPLLLTIIAACGVASGAATPAEQPDKKPPLADIEEGQHFCCFSVTASGKGTGEGCTGIDKVNINSCDKVLYCEGGWVKEDGKVTCL